MGRQVEAALLITLAGNISQRLLEVLCFLVASDRLTLHPMRLRVNRPLPSTRKFDTAAEDAMPLCSPLICSVEG